MSAFDRIDRQFQRPKFIAREAPEEEPKRECPACFDSGWIAYGTGSIGDPHFMECDKCHNPEDIPCP